jgi:hypothetical protein
MDAPVAVHRGENGHACPAETSRPPLGASEGPFSVRGGSQPASMSLSRRDNCCSDAMRERLRSVSRRREVLEHIFASITPRCAPAIRSFQNMHDNGTEARFQFVQRSATAGTREFNRALGITREEIVAAAKSV